MRTVSHAGGSVASFGCRRCHTRTHTSFAYGLLRPLMNGHVKYMRQAIELTRANRTRPFAALLVDHRTDQVVARGTNRSRENPTWHGEVDAINNLAASTAAPGWPDLVMYTTAEPCAMCQAAILWAGIRAVVYGSSIRTLQEMGWKQIDIRSQEACASHTLCSMRNHRWRLRIGMRSVIS